MPTAIAAAGAAAAVGSAFAAAAGYTVLAIGLAVAGQVLGAVAKSMGLSEKQQGVRDTVSDTQAPMYVVYGTTEVGGRVVDVRVDSNDREILGHVTAYSLSGRDGNGINAIKSIWLDDTLAVAGDGTIQDPYDTGGGFLGGQDVINYNKHLGTDSQTVDTELNNRFSSAWPTTSEGKNVAYLRLLLEWHKEKFSGVPTIRAEIDGVNVHDPRDDTFKFSDNSALCVRDLLLSDGYGMGMATDDLDTQSFIDAANQCDEASPTDSSINRFTCNGAIDTSRSLRRNLDEVLSSCRGKLIFQEGKFRLFIPDDQAPVAMQLDEDDIVSNFTWKRKGFPEVANSVITSYVDKNRNEQVVDVQWPTPSQDNPYIEQDGGEENQQEVELPFTTNADTAMRIAQVSVKDSREDTVTSFQADERLLQLEIGDVVAFSHENPGWDQKEFWVNSMAIAFDGTLTIGLSEYADSAYQIETFPSPTAPPGTTFNDPHTVDDPTSVSAVSNNTTQISTPAGDKIPAVETTWTRSTDPHLSEEVIASKLSGDSEWNEERTVKPNEDTFVRITGYEDGQNVDVGVRAINEFGATSTRVTDSTTVGTDYDPSDPDTDITPEPFVSNSTDAAISVDITLDAEPGSDVPSPSLEVRWKEQNGTFSAWQSAPITFTVNRTAVASKSIIGQARDTSLNTTATSKQKQVFVVDGILDGLDPDDGGRVDPTSPLGNGTGQGIFRKPLPGDPDDASSIDYSDGATVDGLQPAQAGADPTSSNPQGVPWLNAGGALPSNTNGSNNEAPVRDTVFTDQEPGTDDFADGTTVYVF